MADKTYNLAFEMSDGTKQHVKFTVPQGDNGDPGEPGYTPVKGVDYWTEADQNEIIEEVLEQIPAGGGSGDPGTWELIGEVTSDGAGDSTGISIPCDLSQYKQVYVNAYNLQANTNFRVVLRSNLTWYTAQAFFGYNFLGLKNSASAIAMNSGTMNNIWSITGIAYNISGRIAAYGAAESKNNSGSAPWRQGAQAGGLMDTSWTGIKYISLDRNSATDIVPEGCTLAAWGYK